METTPFAYHTNILLSDLIPQSEMKKNKKMDRRGIALSAGSACTAGTVVISHVMEALGVPREWAAGSIRFSLGRENTVAEMDAVVGALREVMAELRSLSDRERSLGRRGCI